MRTRAWFAELFSRIAVALCRHDGRNVVFDLAENSISPRCAIKWCRSCGSVQRYSDLWEAPRDPWRSDSFPWFRSRSTNRYQGMAAVVVLAIFLAGCSQIADIFGVSGDGSVGGDGAIVNIDIEHPPSCGCCAESNTCNASGPTSNGVPGLTVTRANCTIANCSAFQVAWSDAVTRQVCYSAAGFGQVCEMLPSGSIVDAETNGPPRDWTVIVDGVSRSVRTDS